MGGVLGVLIILYRIATELVLGRLITGIW